MTAAIATASNTWRPTIAAACSGCKLRRHCFLASSPPGDDSVCADTVKRRFAVPRGDKLYRRNTPSKTLFQVCSGSLKTQRETPNGGLVVTGFFLPGDIVGIEAMADGHYPNDAIATADTEVCQLDFERLLANCVTQPTLNTWMMSRMAVYIRRKDSDLCWSTGLHTHQRVLRFFLDLYDRLGHVADTATEAHALPMRKQDIAYYLHMTPETLSRNLAQLRRTGLLQVQHDRFTLPDADRARVITQL